MPKKTICEVEFEKWWSRSILKRTDPTDPLVKEVAEAVWNLAWKTCGDKIMESIKRKKKGN